MLDLLFLCGEWGGTGESDDTDLRGSDHRDES